jgi:hypothetical protein
LYFYSLLKGKIHDFSGAANANVIYVDEGTRERVREFVCFVRACEQPAALGSYGID